MRTTSAGFAIGSAKPARGDRETRRPSRAGAARCRRGRRALPDRGASGGCAGLHPRAVRSLPPHGAGTPRAVRPALRMNWISPACARGSFSIWSSTSIERADVDLWRVLHGARDILAWWRSHSRTDRRRCVRRASERERLLRTESGARGRQGSAGRCAPASSRAAARGACPASARRAPPVSTALMRPMSVVGSAAPSA